MKDLREVANELRAAALGGRVASSGFLAPQDAARLASMLREAEVGVHAGGGYLGARRRVVTAFPEHIPEASAALAAVRFAPLHDPSGLASLLQAAGIAPHELGDVIPLEGAAAVVTLPGARERLLAIRALEGRPVGAEEFDLADVRAGRSRRQSVVVPSLRVDVLGAKAFRVSRSYFSKGVAGGRVSVNGESAGKSAAAGPGDEVIADGLGRFTVAAVAGQTRRGNVKVDLEVEEQ